MKQLRAFGYQKAFPICFMHFGPLHTFLRFIKHNIIHFTPNVSHCVAACSHREWAAERRHILPFHKHMPPLSTLRIREYNIGSSSSAMGFRNRSEIEALGLVRRDCLIPDASSVNDAFDDDLQKQTQYLIHLSRAFRKRGDNRFVKDKQNAHAQVVVSNLMHSSNVSQLSPHTLVHVIVAIAKLKLQHTSFLHVIQMILDLSIETLSPLEVSHLAYAIGAYEKYSRSKVNGFQNKTKKNSQSGTLAVSNEAQSITAVTLLRRLCAKLVELLRLSNYGIIPLHPQSVLAEHVCSIFWSFSVLNRNPSSDLLALIDALEPRFFEHVKGKDLNRLALSLGAFEYREIQQTLHSFVNHCTKVAPTLSLSELATISFGLSRLFPVPPPLLEFFTKCMPLLLSKLKNRVATKGVYEAFEETQSVKIASGKPDWSFEDIASLLWVYATNRLVHNEFLTLLFLEFSRSFQWHISTKLVLLKDSEIRALYKSVCMALWCVKELKWADDRFLGFCFYNLSKLLQKFPGQWHLTSKNILLIINTAAVSNCYQSSLFELLTNVLLHRVFVDTLEEAHYDIDLLMSILCSFSQFIHISGDFISKILNLFEYYYSKGWVRVDRMRLVVGIQGSSSNALSPQPYAPFFTGDDLGILLHSLSVFLSKADSFDSAVYQRMVRANTLCLKLAASPELPSSHSLRTQFFTAYKFMERMNLIDSQSYQTADCFSIHISEEDIEAIRNKANEWQLQVHRNFESFIYSSFKHSMVYQILKESMFRDFSFVPEQYISSSGSIVDLLDVSTRVVVEFDGPSHCVKCIEWSPAGGDIATQRRIDGSTALKTAILEADNWSVIRIPFYTWDTLHTLGSKKAYLRQLLDQVKQ